MAPVHFDNTFGNGEAEAGSALFPGTGTVGLVELLEDTLLVGFREAGTRVSHGDHKSVVGSICLDPDFSRLGELDGVADKIQ